MVEGARLESVYRRNSIEGSNPSLSASLFAMTCEPQAGKSGLAEVLAWVAEHRSGKKASKAK